MIDETICNPTFNILHIAEYFIRLLLRRDSGISQYNFSFNSNSYSDPNTTDNFNS